MGLKMYFCVGSWLSALSQVPPVQRSELGKLVLSHCVGPGNWTQIGILMATTFTLFGGRLDPVSETKPHHHFITPSPGLPSSEKFRNCKGRLTRSVHKKRKWIFKITALKQKAQPSLSWLLEAKISKHIPKGIAEKSQLAKNPVRKGLSSSLQNPCKRLGTRVIPMLWTQIYLQSSRS